jgi:hypothetical protein
MPRAPGRHPRNEPTFSTPIERDIPCRASGSGVTLTGGLAQMADVGASDMTAHAAGLQGGGQARQWVSGKGRGSDAETGARQVGQDQGDRQARRYEGDKGQRRKEGATQEIEDG